MTLEIIGVARVSTGSMRGSSCCSSPKKRSETALNNQIREIKRNYLFLVCCVNLPVSP